MQYTPVLNTGANWQIYNGPGFTGAVDIPKDVWFHLRLDVSGAQAKLFVKDMEKPALVITDLMMPIMDGWELVDRIRGSDRLAGVPVVVISAVPPSQAPPGIRELLRKPVNAGAVLKAVEHHADHA